MENSETPSTTRTRVAEKLFGSVKCEINRYEGGQFGPFHRANIYGIYKRDGEKTWSKTNSYRPLQVERSLEAFTFYKEWLQENAPDELIPRQPASE